jgi:hypothetical protein
MKVICISLIMACCLYGWSPITTNTGREFQIIRHNINSVELCVSNYGKFGQDETGNNAGCWWPIGSGQNYIYGAGLWVGGVDSISGDTMVTIGHGPQGGEAEFGPGLCGMSVSDPEAVIYLYPNLWPPSDATFPMAPETSLSHQDSWCVYNDSNILYHIAGDTRPIGIEVYQSVHAWNLNLLRDIIYIVFEIKNVSGSRMIDCYLGICADNDIGNEAGAVGNDRMSGIVGQWYVIDGDSFYVDNIAYQWQEVEEPGTPPWFPGVMGFDLIRTPYDLVEDEDKDNDGILDQYERDSVYFVNNLPIVMWDVDHDGVLDWCDPSEIPQLGMTALKRFTLNLEPGLDYERYTTLAGYNFRTGIYEPYDTVFSEPDDQRWLQASGPFDLRPDSTVTFVLALVFANWYEIYYRPDTALVLIDHWAQFCHDQNWLLPGPPPPPTLTLVPGDASITLVWDNTAETTPDPYWDVVGTDPSSPLYDPYYRQYDFEGYRVWKSTTGQTGTWELLASFDLSNDVAFIDTAFMPEPLEVTNTGVQHFFTDDDVRNGFVYYYAVTSFDYNEVKTVIGDSIFPTAVWFESGLGGDTIRARREPANYVAGSYEVVTLAGNPNLSSLVSAVISVPLDMTADDQYVDFGPIIYADGMPLYTADLLDASYVLVSSKEATPDLGQSVVNDFPLYQGMNVIVNFERPAMTVASVIFDSVTVVSGSYPADYLEPRSMGVLNGLWAYRGNAYEIHWMAKDPGGLVNTVVVIDVFTGDTIPYAPFAENAGTDSLAMSWSLHVSASVVRDTLVYDTPGPPALGTKYMYLCGGKFNLKNGLDLVTGDPRPEDGEVWYVYPTANFVPAPAYGRVQIVSDPAYFDTVAQELNVKVVPNPYVIYNEWQTRFVQRRVKFINLPSQCTIRIFNLNGELVRTLTHTATSTGAVSNNLGGDEWWDVLSENRQLVASGVYIFHIESDVGEQVGKFVIVR